MAFREDIPVDGGSTTVSTTTGLGIGSPVDTWTTAEIVLTFGAGSSSVSIWVNGVATLNAVPTSAHLYVRPVEIDLGILTFDFGAAAQEVFVDDLLVDIK